MTSLDDATPSSHNENKEKVKVLFFGRSKCDATDKAINFLNRLDFEVTTVKSNGRGESLPEDIDRWTGDYIFCFRSLFVLPKRILERAKIAAINFHPGSAEYPGSGCLNFALYENAKEYGVTAHLMSEKVDDGSIIECRRFPIVAGDTVDSLLERTHLKLLDLFLDTVGGIGTLGDSYIKSSLIKSGNEKWRGEARRMKELDRLSTIDIGVSALELERIIRATHTDLFPPRIMLHGYEFALRSPKKKTS
ncbi:hypothetical protein LOY33_17095 [Pseudomonas sp. B21-036]|jgi:methionyl-tRNA formyltransferase|uniref:formyltransferase family protein n=1 Tax=unclassified Pseudomonas TaxID=196821 RepID=UPI00215E1AF6|nr:MULTISPECIES: formyltransferase family protein [unclassified Pseudomonas]MDD1955359.1 hypothetical protein [Pseudomonas sp. 8209]UVL49696.1 hypothetical protein LOY33_17095 [Pseudomonas sp. B21-036]